MVKTLFNVQLPNQEDPIKLYRIKFKLLKTIIF